MQSWSVAAVVLLAWSGSGCDLMKGKPASKEKDAECEPCPKCSDRGGSAKTPAEDDKEPGVCDALGSFVDAMDGSRSLYGDVELTRAGVGIADADRLVDAMVNNGGAESAEGALGMSAILVRGRRELSSTTIMSLPKSPSRRKDLERYLTTGRLPEHSTTPEIALGRKLARYLKAEKGDEITVAAMPNAATVGLAPSVRQAKIVGLLDLPGEPVFDNESGLALMEADDIRTIGLVQPGLWASVRVWYKPGERAAGVLKLQQALAGVPMVNYVTLDQSVADLSSLRPTLEAICASK